ncbi:2-oxo-Delta(3)-4,5,5-trimethylcyclopentenylacetyl-CoA monooxygenase [Geodia barretti]|uniref:2-oxo-Delta(3)-4,5,5-trimethylcyclopentenylacetyl -CoA monooxygenase n=1 Tax=Geodia barretti TaxID=519541 RepID=A0AA35T1T9_GEOBA|nr:2-oxo-Delta(3)-4,5,5-trimethylcyclopentenylacetyl-CoA monooxygenase [Geodia barretti]
MRNRPITEEEQEEIRSRYPEIFEKCLETAGSFMHEFDTRSAFSVSEEERVEQYEKLWSEPGFKKWLSNFYDVMMPGPANEDYAEFFRNKIRERVKDPMVAEMLAPKDHMFGSKRLPCESGYYEVYNQDNTADAHYEFDVIIYATGYDAVTGSLNRMHIQGKNGLTLQEKFAEGPRTFMGIQSVDFPNLFTINAASVGNFVRAAEPLVEWISECAVSACGPPARFTRSRHRPTRQSEDEWTQHMIEGGKNILRTQADNWFVGANIPGKARFLLTAPDTAPVMRAKRAEIASDGYKGFNLE